LFLSITYKFQVTYKNGLAVYFSSTANNMDPATLNDMV